MARRLILDINALIDYERGRLDQVALDDDELAIAAITVAEYRTGIELAGSVERAAARSRALALITETIEVLDYTEVTAAHHARLIAHTRRSGKVRGAHDLVIAAHAAQTGRVVLSRDAVARFGDLPGVIAEAPAER
ncbi:PIN domain-containing protein [Georgenia satyanarayanai]|uniref:PIN domain-containing protein n=1 Tax=Georgenia satyanarayanai TaxID=860221 RepID=UPI00203F2CF1|nr:PIN domain-containing protein [Georgenia satyanarayanai]MCM3659403.1 PIN domain-containing protein [Georgenia satyanarayanai]